MDKLKRPNTKLQHERQLRGWSQARLAEKLGTTVKRVSLWECGDTKPDRYYQEKLCDLFGKNAAELGLLDNETAHKREHEQTSNLPESKDNPGEGQSSLSLKQPLAKDITSQETNSTRLLIPGNVPVYVTVQLQQASISPSSNKNGMITIEEISYLPVLGSESSSYMDYQRREFLQILGVASSALLLSFPLDWERVVNALEKPSRLDLSVLENFETLNKHLWHLYLSSATKSLVLDGVLGQFKMLAQLLKEPHSSQLHERLCELTSDLSQLAGEIFFDRHEYETAKTCYGFAMSTAKEAKSPDLWASAVIRSSFIPLYEERYEEAYTLLKEAGHVAQHGESTFATQFWAAAVEAEAASGTGDLAACQDALGRAQGILNRKVVNPIWLRFDGTRLPALQGACFVRLQKPNLAIPSLEEALLQFSEPSRRRGLVLVDFACAALQSQEVERACRYASEVIDIVALGSSSFLRKELHKLRQQLTPFADTVFVKTLDQQLAALA